MNNKYILVILICAIIFTSCSTKSKLSIRPAKTLKKQELIDKLQTENPNFVALSIKYTAEIEGNSLINSAHGNIRVYKDSLIWATMGLGMGIELGRALFDKTDFQVVDFRNKTYYKGKYDVSQKLFGSDINFETLQATLTGAFYLPYGLESVATDENFTENKNREFEINEISANLKTYFVIDSNSFKMKELKIEKIDEPMTIQVKFGNYIKLGDKKFPNKISIIAKSGNNETVINIFYDKVKFDQEVKIPFRIPQKYDTVIIQ